MRTGLTGGVYNRLTVLERLPNHQGKRTFYRCKCECGNFVTVEGSCIKFSVTKSCGCLAKEANRKGKHYMSNERMYVIWGQMKGRCSNKNLRSYRFYGALGVKVCERWQNSFNNFYDDMKDGYEDNLTLERNNPFGNYEKENCQWASIQRQANNRSTNIYLEYDGQRHTVADWERKLGFSPSVIHQRRGYGWSIDKIFSTPQRKSPKRKNNVTI